MDFFFYSSFVVLVSLLLPLWIPCAKSRLSCQCLLSCCCVSDISVSLLCLSFSCCPFVCSPSFLSSMLSLYLWCSPFILPGRDETLTYQALPIWSIQVDCHQASLTKNHFPPVCVFMNLLSVCLSDCCGGWCDVEWRFLWPVVLYVIS